MLCRTRLEKGKDDERGEVFTCVFLPSSSVFLNDSAELLGTDPAGTFYPRPCSPLLPDRWPPGTWRKTVARRLGPHGRSHEQ